MEYMNEKEGKSKKGFLIAVVIALFIITGVACVFYFNIGGVTHKLLMPALSKIQVFDNILLKTDDDQYSQYSREELVEIIKEYEGQIKELEEDKMTQDNIIDDKDKEIARLQTFESEQINFKKDKENFDKMLIENQYAPTIDSYIEFYETMYPETAKEVYERACEKKEYDKDVKDYVMTYQEMDADSAAAILEKVAITDSNLVVAVLDSLPTETRAEILEAMTTNIAARISKLLAPKEY